MGGTGRNRLAKIERCHILQSLLRGQFPHQGGAPFTLGDRGVVELDAGDQAFLEFGVGPFDDRRQIQDRALSPPRPPDHRIGAAQCDRGRCRQQTDANRQRQVQGDIRQKTQPEGNRGDRQSPATPADDVELANVGLQFRELQPQPFGKRRQAFASHANISPGRIIVV